MSTVKSEAKECSKFRIRIILECPYCKADNSLTLPEEYKVDVLACRCISCRDKFYLPESKEELELIHGYILNGDDNPTTEELGLELGEDLIECAYFEEGQ